MTIEPTLPVFLPHCADDFQIVTGTGHGLHGMGDGALDERVAADRGPYGFAVAAGRVVYGLQPVGFHAEVDCRVLGHSPIVAQCVDNVLTISDNVDTMCIHKQIGDTMQYTADRNRYTDENGVSWAPGQKLPENASPALCGIAYRMAAWNNASTYPWKQNVWQAWMDRAEAVTGEVAIQL